MHFDGCCHLNCEGGDDLFKYDCDSGFVKDPSKRKHNLFRPASGPVSDNFNRYCCKAEAEDPEAGEKKVGIACSREVVADSKHVPDMAGGGRTEVDTVELCREHCVDLAGCVHYSFWAKDGGCHLADITATLKSDKWGGTTGSLCQ